MNLVFALDDLTLVCESYNLTLVWIEFEFSLVCLGVGVD